MLHNRPIKVSNGEMNFIKAIVSLGNFNKNFFNKFSLDESFTTLWVNRPTAYISLQFDQLIFVQCDLQTSTMVAKENSSLAVD